MKKNKLTEKQKEVIFDMVQHFWTQKGWDIHVSIKDAKEIKAVFGKALLYSKSYTWSDRPIRIRRNKKHRLNLSFLVYYYKECYLASSEELLELENRLLKSLDR